MVIEFFAGTENSFCCKNLSMLLTTLKFLYEARSFGAQDSMALIEIPDLKLYVSNSGEITIYAS